MSFLIITHTKPLSCLHELYIFSKPCQDKVDCLPTNIFNVPLGGNILLSVCGDYQNWTFSYRRFYLHTLMSICTNACSQMFTHASRHTRTQVKFHSNIVMEMSINTYTVGQVGCKWCSTVVSHLGTKLWNCCQQWPISFLPNIQCNLEKQRQTWRWM